MSGEYVLGHDIAEDNRLNRQHYLHEKILGFIVHPIIPMTSSPALNIADVACGTGIFIQELSKRLPPTCTFTGFDKSSSQFPDTSSLPGNLTFKPQSILESFPPKETGKYDLVTVRLLSVVLAREEWEMAVRRVYTLLKPGGYLQWIDIDAASTNLYMSGPGQGSLKALRELQEGMRVFGVVTKRACDGCRALPTLFEKVGLVDVVEENYASDRVSALREEYSATVIGAARGVVRILEGVEGSGWTVEKGEILITTAEKDIKDGAYIVNDFICIVGRKRL